MSADCESKTTSGACPALAPASLIAMETDMKEMKSTLAKIAENQQEIMLQLAKKRGFKFGFEGGDENEERGNWTGKLDFFLSCLGCAVGLGNVWRFPYLCYKNGGGAFLIPFGIFLVLSGTPIFLLELSLGQFTSCGPLKCWDFAPIFRGMGIGMVVVSLLCCIYYNVLMAWSFYYMFASFTWNLPWSYCGSWSSQLCNGRLHKVNKTCNDLPNAFIDNSTGINGTCWLEVNNTRSLYGIYDAESAKTFNYVARSASDEYLNYVGLQDKLGNLTSMGPLRWDMSLCLILAWAVVCLSLIKGIKSSGKVVYFTAMFPYAVLLVLLIRGLTLPGAWDGVAFMLRPQLSKLGEAVVWKDAAVQVFYSLSTGSGGLITLASYNRFRTDTVRDTMAVVVADFFTSIFSGIVVFSFLGFMAFDAKKSVDQVVDSGVSLAFTVYPQVVAKLPAAPVWAVLFFFMLVTLGLDSQFTMVETVVTAIEDQWPRIRQRRTLLIVGVSVALCLVGLSMCTPGGPQLLTIFDDYSGSWNVMALSVLECLAIAWVYGARRFANDIEVMTGPIVCGCLQWRYIKWWWMACWGVISPLLLLVVMIFSWVQFEPSQYSGHRLPAWSQAVGWLLTLCGLAVAIAVSGREAWGLRHSLRDVLRPAASWGPALPQFRRAVADAGYAWDFVLEPGAPDGVADGKELRADLAEGANAGVQVRGIPNSVFQMHESTSTVYPM